MPTPTRDRQMVVAERSWGERPRLVNASCAQQGLLAISQPIIIRFRFQSQTFEFHELLRVELTYKIIVEFRRPTKLIADKIEIDRSEVGIEIIGSRGALLGDLQQVVPKKER